MSEKIVVGIDAGGTHTRLMAADLKGHILAYKDTNSSRMVNNTAIEENMKNAITELITQSGHETADVAALVAGIAGLNREEDIKMMEGLTNVPGLDCARVHINDVDIAYAGVTLGKPGIVASAGTGWAGMARTEDGRRILTYAFPLLLGTSSFQIAWFVIAAIIAGMQQREDKEFVQEILDYLSMKDAKQLGEVFLTENWFMTEFGMHLREVAPIVTAAAMKGVPLACDACERAIYNVEQAIRVLGRSFTSETVIYGLTGSVLRSCYIRRGVEQRLCMSTDKRYELISHPLSPAAGAVVIALEKVGVECSEEVITALRDHPEATL